MGEIGQLFKETYSEWSSNKAPRLAAALSYYPLLAMAPLLVIVVQIGMIEPLNSPSGQVTPERQAVTALTSGTDVIDAGAWQLNLDMNYNAQGTTDSVDGYHLTDGGAQKVANYAIAQLVASRPGPGQ